MRYETISAEHTFTAHANRGCTYLALLAIPGTQPQKHHSVIWRVLLSLVHHANFFVSIFRSYKNKRIHYWVPKGLDMLCDINKLLL